MDFDEDDLGNSQDSQQFRQGYYIRIFIFRLILLKSNQTVEQKLCNKVTTSLLILYIGETEFKMFSKTLSFSKNALKNI